jgi:cell division septation protein DedD
MSPDRDPRFPADEPDDNFRGEEPPRSIFSAAWFRVVLVLLGIGVVGAVAVPYVLDVVKPTPEGAGSKTVATRAPSATPPAMTPTPAPKPAPAEKPPAVVAEAPKPEMAKPGTAKQETAKPAPKPPAKKEPAAEAPKAAPAEKAAAARPAPTRAKASEGGDYFVQVGAFRDPATAKRLAARLREENYPVDESVKRVGGAAGAAPRPSPRAAAPSGPDRYDVIVSGGSAADINAKLAAKGLASEPAGDSVRIRPSLSLRDAVALSKDLGSEGFKVQVRRGGGASAEPAPPAAATSEAGGATLHRVRVGGYPDRAAAQAVLKELQDKGHQPFIAKGRE